MKASETQVGGNHYKDMGEFQPWDVLQRWLTPEEYRGYQKGVAIAYLAREQFKGGDQDIRKAAHHLQKLIETLDEAEAQHAETAPVVVPPAPGYDPAIVAFTKPCCGHPDLCERPCFHRPAPPEKVALPARPGYGSWIEWAGGDCPVSEGTLVRVMHRSGNIFSGPALYVAGITASNWSFGAEDGPAIHSADIVRYSVKQ